MSQDLPKLDVRGTRDLIQPLPESKPDIHRIENIPPVPAVDAGTSFLEDLWLYIRNRLKRQSSEEGQGVDSGSLIPSIPKLLSIGSFFAAYWPLVIGLIVILGILFATGILKL
jgi:hypothetical protein